MGILQQVAYAMAELRSNRMKNVSGTAKLAEVTAILNALQRSVEAPPTQRRLLVDVRARGLDAVRAQVLFKQIGITGATLVDSSNNVLVFQVNSLLSCVAPLTKFYGEPRNLSDLKILQKKLQWKVEEVRGLITLTQIANQHSLLIFQQL